MDFKILSLDETLKTIVDYGKFIELHIHHTWRPNKQGFTGTNHIALQNGMYKYHVNTNGWDNIAQHLTLCPDGKFVTGRPYNKMAISMSNHNLMNALSIEMIGDFDIGKDKLDGDQKIGILTISKWFIDKGYPVVFHNEYSDKTCPGSGINKDQFIKEAKALVGKVEKPIVIEGTAKAWQQTIGEKAIDKLFADGKLSNPEDWKKRDLLNENTPLWLFFEMMTRV